MQGVIVNGNPILPPDADIQAGGSAATAQLGGVLSVNTTQVGTDADTNEKDLWTYTLPANTLNVDGKTIRITTWGTTAANTNTKLTRIRFGNSSLISSGANAANGVTWVMRCVITRTGASAQLGFGEVQMGATLGSPNNATPSEVSSGDIAIRVTGTNGTANANDVVFRGAIVEVLN